MIEGQRMEIDRRGDAAFDSTRVRIPDEHIAWAGFLRPTGYCQEGAVTAVGKGSDGAWIWSDGERGRTGHGEVPGMQFRVTGSREAILARVRHDPQEFAAMADQPSLHAMPARDLVKEDQSGAVRARREILPRGRPLHTHPRPFSGKCGDALA